MVKERVLGVLWCARAGAGAPARAGARARARAGVCVCGGGGGARVWFRVGGGTKCRELKMLNLKLDNLYDKSDHFVWGAKKT